MSKYDHAATLKRMRRARSNKTAAGMTATLERQRACGTFRGHSDYDTARLAVHGTLDVLASTMRTIGKAKCTCCNGTGRAGYEMTDKGRRRLKQLRRNHSA